MMHRYGVDGDGPPTARKRRGLGVVRDNQPTEGVPETLPIPPPSFSSSAFLLFFPPSSFFLGRPRSLTPPSFCSARGIDSLHSFAIPACPPRRLRPSQACCRDPFPFPPCRREGVCLLSRSRSLPVSTTREAVGSRRKTTHLQQSSHLRCDPSYMIGPRAKISTGSIAARKGRVSTLRRCLMLGIKGVS